MHSSKSKLGWMAIKMQWNSNFSETFHPERDLENAATINSVLSEFGLRFGSLLAHVLHPSTPSLYPCFTDLMTFDRFWNFPLLFTLFPRDIFSNIASVRCPDLNDLTDSYRWSMNLKPWILKNISLMASSIVSNTLWNLLFAALTCVGSQCCRRSRQPLGSCSLHIHAHSTSLGEKYERHCPGKGRMLDCVVPRPEGYRRSIPLPQSRDEVWSSNVPHTRLVEDKGGQNWMSIKKDKFIFPGGGTQFIHGADQYLNQISQAMVPEISFGHHIHVALDIGCGVASFGAFLLHRNVTTLSIAPKDVHENQIQFALERGVPAMVAVFATHRLLYPSQAFDLIHCSRWRIKWIRDYGILLLEVNRMLRAGGYFVWAAQPVYKHEEILQEQWKEMEDLTSRFCWELVKEGYIAIWRKPLNNTCYLNNDTGALPPLCDPNDNSDNVWYADLRACITQLPVNGYGSNVSTWPARLHVPPDRLQSIEMDGYISRKEIFRAESKYWNEIIELHTRFSLERYETTFAAALIDLQIDCWVMNVVPVSGFNTLPVIYDRRLIGVMHDWCEPFDTYPRTYDLLHASGLFSVEKKRCNMSTIMLEMDRILRPSGRVYIRDSISVIGELKEIASAMGWVSAVHDIGEGPHASWKILISENECDVLS
ncbi:putative methyltransferase PMT10 [Hibiscus syriacus]|uniref:Methyltransferase n=1 Tax=Hibiscus syriacus TaxID=106335 RepID=A0A6A3CQZ7_HIBSY|nr:putative methyltransferase PMT10 [Hibiscus syriacus]